VIGGEIRVTVIGGVVGMELNMNFAVKYPIEKVNFSAKLEDAYVPDSIFS
jgi:hypothetical protein